MIFNRLRGSRNALDEAERLRANGDRATLEDSKIKLRDLVNQGKDVESLVSEQGWKTLAGIFNEARRIKEIEMRDTKATDHSRLAAAMYVNALDALWNIARARKSKMEYALSQYKEICAPSFEQKGELT